MQQLQTLLKKHFLLIAFLVVCLIALVFVFPRIAVNFEKTSVPPELTNAITADKETFSYKGEEGKDALTLLKEKTTVGQDASGLVSSINGRKAETAKREYWAFYVNKEMASVGPAEYQTKETDTIMWKIETY